jgi:hypothetical protein
MIGAPPDLAFAAPSLGTYVSHSQTKVTISATFFRWNRTI